MANLSTLQDHLEVIRTGTVDQKKQKLTPESIADVRSFIATERANRDKGTHYSLESQFHEWEDLIRKFEGDKQAITTTAATATTEVRQTVPVATVPAQEITEESIRKQSEDIRKSLDATMTMEKLESSLKLTESLAKMIPATHMTLGRGVIGSMMLGRLQELGYSLSVDSKNQVLIRSEHTDKVQEVKNKINAFVAVPGSAMLDIIKTGTLYMSPTFREYSASNMIDGKIVVEKTPADYGKYLELKPLQNPKKDTIVSDLNFIDSLKSGGYNGFNFTQAMVQSQGLGKVAQFIDSNPAIAEKIATTVAPAVNPGTLPVTSTSSQRPSTTAGKAAGVVGEGVGAVAGGIGAVVGNVASETASTWSTILSEATKSGGAFGAIGVIGLVIASIWKFGFGKTLMGIIGVGGASAIANAAENGTFDKFADKLNKGAKKAGEAAEKAFDSGKAAVASATPVVAEATKPAEKKEEFTESPTQKKISDKIRNNEEFKKIFEKEKTKNKATLDDYLLFINKDLGGVKVSTLLSNTNSVFAENTSLDASIKIPSNFDSAIFRNIMRMYFTGTYISEFKINEEINTKARQAALGKIPTMDVTLSDAINKIHG